MSDYICLQRFNKNMKIPSIITQLLLLAFLVSISKATILITSPAINPFQESKIPYAYTNVGSIPYGKTLTFDLVQKPDLNFCLNPSNTTTSLFTDPTYVIIEPRQQSCSYVTLALNAQFLGAKGVLIVSDMVNYFQNMVPIDDGNGRKVHISVLMVTNLTYLQLKLIKNIQIKVQYEVYKSQKANFTYFLSATGRANYIFLRQFQPYYEKIQDFINFRPIYLTFPCPYCPQSECLISSDYCLFQMDTYVDGVGQFILKQQIRQWNIYKEFGTSKYLSYMNDFDKLCTTNWLVSESCGDNILNTLKLQNPKNQQTPSEIMNDWRKHEVASGFWSTPQLTINAQIYAGTQDAQDVFNAICASLLNPPAVCLGQGQLPSKKGNKVGWIIGSIIIACILSIILGLIIYKRCVKKQLTKDMFSKVNELVARYATKVSEHNKKRKDKLKMRLTEEL